MIRQPAVAGRFYDGDAQDLAAVVDTMMTFEPEPNLRALIVPHAGYVYSGATAGHGYSLIEPDGFTRVILMGPSHYAGREIAGVSVAGYEAYAIPGATVRVDREAADSLLECPLVDTVDAAHVREHCLEVQLPFIHQRLPNARIVPILCGHLRAADLPVLADAIGRIWDENTLVVVSSDFNHVGRNYGFLPFPENATAEQAPQLDGRAIDRIVAKDLTGFQRYLAETEATICGRDAISILLTMLPESSTVKLLDYTNSGRVSGDYSSCVGYAAIAVTGPAQTEYFSAAEKALMLKVAKDAIEARLLSRPYTVPEDAPARLMEEGACFVTLRINHELRGCIGTLEAREPLLQNVASNAANAAFNDYRFGKLDASEFSRLQYHVSVLTPARPVSGIDEIVIGTHGIILRHAQGRAVFLPEVALEQGWNLTTTLEHLSRKAGLPEDAWKESSFQVFETVSFGD